MLLFRRVQPTLAGLASTVSGPVRGAFQGFAQQMRVQRTLAVASGVTLTRYGAAWAAVQSRVGFLGGMTAAFRSASGAGTTFMGTLNGIGRAAGSGLASAGRGLMNTLGGPWGVALAVATVGLGMYAAHQQKAAQAAAEHEQRVSALTDALRESNGIIDQNVRAQAAQILMDTKTADGKQRLVDVMRNAGVSLSDLTDAYLGQGTSLGTLQQQLSTVASAHDDVWQTNETGDTWQGYDVMGRRARDAADELGKVKGEMGESVQRAKELAEAQRGTGAGTSAYDRLKTAVGELADETSDADQRTRALKDALDLLSGGQISLQAAKARVNAAVLNLNESTDTVDRSNGYGGKQLVNQGDGTLNTTTRNGQQLYTQMTSLSDAAAEASTAIYTLAQQNGEELPQALAKSRAEMTHAREEAIKAARGYGLTRTEAEKVADSLGLLPSKVYLLLQTKGLDSTLANLLAVQAEFDRFPDRKTIRVDSVSESAQKKLKELGFTVKTVPGTRQIKITAPTEAARKSLNALIKQLGQTPGSKKVTVSAATKAAIGGLQAVQSEIKATPGRKTVTVKAPTATARKELEALGFKITKVPGSKKVKVTIPTGSAAKAVSTIQGRINSLRGKTVPRRHPRTDRHRDDRRRPATARRAPPSAARPASPYIEADPCQIIRDVWAYAQAQPDGDLDVIVDDTKSETTTGTSKTPYTLPKTEARNLGEVIDEMADLDDGPEWTETVSWNGRPAEHRIRVGAPRLGLRREDITFTSGINIATTPQAVQDADSYAQTVVGLGSGSGSKRLHAVDTVRNARLRLEHLLETSEKDAAKLKQRVRTERLTRQTLTDLTELEVRDHPAAPFGSWAIGDDVLVRLHEQHIEYEGWHRITGWTLRPPDGEEAERITLTLERTAKPEDADETDEE